ncbi:MULTISPECIES: glutathione S-transferase family protein [unclassified Bosea (in: a-proteobacteria)]|uniref:glutathione S-transferase family protein n=1 Tax=unclassified Bosea (in: a-proteobacteria) TaxID=2653178 RepID=UPI000F754DD0|nr:MULTISPECIES: glutathione S-transferase family protein [unclassified Bosea (in: a-proteobacteria)]AZO76474.1 glutathione S-transferase [Bosea sp. Tri-49]RXT26400.1 glutathione S-transferase [Bosea sp. Tri-39]RXT31641.1 glutathione S-transferase [Bosea sp. Tri-54]
MKLIIANKTHSSWSLRPWLVLAEFGIPFEEVLVPFGPTFDDPEWKRTVAEYTPARKVPSLVDGAIAVWDSIAIIEYLAETHPELPIWPRDKAARALARSICAEMHSSFAALRSACPMNLAWVHPARDRGPAVAADIARVTEIWRDARQRFGAGGDFRFGDFSAADAMFAPVATRFTTYSIALDPVSAAYVAAVQGTAGFKTWREAALAEPWIVSEDEVDEPVLTDFRPNLSRSKAQR